MKRTLVIVLAVIAVGIYTYNAFLLIRPSAISSTVKKKQDDKDQSLENLIARSKPVKFVKSDRNPFLPRSEKQGEPVRKQTSLSTTPRLTVKAPAVTINGIMWDPESPLAMIVLPDGSSAAVKTGQTVGDITVKKIEKERICIVFQNRTFWITR